MNKITKLMAASAFVVSTFPGAALALEVPEPGPFDDRVKFINYNSSQVVKIVGHFGFSTHIQFREGEEVVKVALGDPKAWELKPYKNHVFLKPLGDDPITNMQVLTSERVYNFELDAHWSENGAHPVPNDMFFQINFRYPDEEAALAKAKAEALELKAKLNDTPEPEPKNWNYWAKGSQEITPSRAFDDERFTYLEFPNNREIPAVFVVDADGNESLVNIHVDPENPGRVVIHRVVKRIMLRKGNAVTCIFNQSYDPDGIGNPTGTTAPGVHRVIRGQ